MGGSSSGSIVTCLLLDQYPARLMRCNTSFICFDIKRIEDKKNQHLFFNMLLDDKVKIYFELEISLKAKVYFDHRIGFFASILVCG